MSFGLICEGPTDQAAIENILCGIFQNEDLLELITALQPGSASEGNLDGGWERVLLYLANHKFRQSFSMVSNVVVQIDTDVAGMKNFDVDLRDTEGIVIKDVAQIVSKVKQRLIDQINSGEADFYERHSKRIVFAITVHSLEIWLFKHYSKMKQKQSTINSGEKKLALELQKDKKLSEFTIKVKNKEVLMSKNYDNYESLTRPFFDKKTRDQSIQGLYESDLSFRSFKDDVHQLQP